MRTLNVGISMCGGCNPRIDRERLVMKLVAYLEPKGHRILLNTKQVDSLICVSGCSASCADEPVDANMKKTVIAGETMDAFFVSEDLLGEEILRKEANYYG